MLRKRPNSQLGRVRILPGLLERSAPKPDIYYGAKPSQLDRRVRRDLAGYIVPSGRSDLPAAPNFFLEGKSAAGRADVAQNQAMYDGAVGARAMLQLQNYGQPTPRYDGNAYTVTSTYHPGTGTLQMYATHPRPSVAPAGEPQYYMTQLDGHYMTGTSDNFRKGAAAYRNARDWTQQQRDRLISGANAVAQTMSPNIHWRYDFFQAACLFPICDITTATLENVDRIDTAMAQES
ncbi:hypothetical protein CERZMDRAFT_83547 [Cercospora zeae-maydis SCOH1-5]|uniref:DUF7924 domain-containing protein n=1 Tax=Cercospora zeae-maydis SCOH1-5 TaxID=717836 RepID=A0A6A6FL50_9PEZI|nr:hypothetical protein CERZMDRAFT_83547 [Cercospora zeae-maydis SCOH1-5]